MSDPGLQGAVPFRFACQRSGRCCRVGAGYVWLEEDDGLALAEALGVTPEVFWRESTRQVPDPRTGELRRALREGTGIAADRCRFLEGTNECSVYEARPAHCRDFPYWPSVLEGGEGFERARQVCPGITPEPSHEEKQAAFAELEALYQALQAELNALSPRCELSGFCCRFEEAGHELFAGALETDFALARHPEPGEPEASGRCPYHQQGRCTAREGRPLACRTYFCDESKEEALFELHERYLKQVRAIEARHGYDRRYARFPELVLAFRSRVQ